MLLRLLSAVCFMLQRHAEALGQRAKVDKAYIMNFGEEVVRGQPVFVLSGLLQDLEGHLREAAGAGPWQVMLTGIQCIWL
jgi:alpha-glucan,water dikinase